MKKLLLFLWLLLPQTIMAQVNTVVVNMKDGSTTRFLLATNPVITYMDNNLVITTTSQEVSLPVENIENVTLEGRSIATTIDQVIISENSIQMRQLPVGATVRVFTVDGRTVSTHEVGNGGNLTLNISELPKGVLVINTPTTTIKVNNKNR